MPDHDPLGGDSAEDADWTPNLTIPSDKLSEYLLNLDHPDGGPKAQFFLDRGFSPPPNVWLIQALFHHARPSNLVKDMATGFGTKYVYEGIMRMPDESSHRVRSVWFEYPNDPRRFLVTAYPF